MHQSPSTIQDHRDKKKNKKNMEATLQTMTVHITADWKVSFVRFPWTRSVVTSICISHNASAETTDSVHFSSGHSSMDCRSDTASGHLSSLTTSAASGGWTDSLTSIARDDFELNKCSCQTGELFSGTTCLSAPTRNTSRSIIFVSFFEVHCEKEQMNARPFLHWLTNRLNAVKEA